MYCWGLDIKERSGKDNHHIQQATIIYINTLLLNCKNRKYLIPDSFLLFRPSFFIQQAHLILGLVFCQHTRGHCTCHRFGMCRGVQTVMFVLVCFLRLPTTPHDEVSNEICQQIIYLYFFSSWNFEEFWI